MKDVIKEITVEALIANASDFKSQHPKGIGNSIGVQTSDFYDINFSRQWAYEANGEIEVVWAILQCGEIVTLVKRPGVILPMLRIFEHIQKHGGKYMFAVATEKLYSLYTAHGYLPLAWIRWDHDYAPVGWDYERYGEPNSAFYVLQSLIPDKIAKEYLNKQVIFQSYSEAHAFVCRCLRSTMQ